MQIEKYNLVIFKNYPAIVISTTGKIELTFLNSTKKHVREKDVDLLHKGPVKKLSDLKQIPIEEEIIDEARQVVIEEDKISFSDLVELIFEKCTPSTSLSTWYILQEHIYFEASIKKIKARSDEEIQNIISKKKEEKLKQEKRQEALTRIKNYKIITEDKQYLKEIENFALNQITYSPLLKELKIPQSLEAAHKLLLNTNYWKTTFNPYPYRFNLNLTEDSLSEISEFPNEARKDLTHLETYAIDDSGCIDPDDAFSIDNNFFWIHIADVAALVHPNSQLDQSALEKGASLYLPEKYLPMLPNNLTELLSLKGNSKTLALSFKLKIDGQTNINLEEIVPSYINVKSLSYEEAEKEINNEPLKSIFSICSKYHQKRYERGAIQLNFPEVKLKVENEQIYITRINQSLKSRNLVVNIMLMLGEAVAKFAIDNKIPIPFSTQNVNYTADQPLYFSDRDLASMYSSRKKLKPSSLQTIPSQHQGLGLEYYVKATSPLRRYSDLIAHQQIRAFIKNKKLMDEEEVSKKINISEQLQKDIMNTERKSKRHWTLIYMDSVKWQGRAILVEKFNDKGKFIIPDLAFETSINGINDIQLNDKVSLTLKNMNLENLTASFLLI